MRAVGCVLLLAGMVMVAQFPARDRLGKVAPNDASKIPHTHSPAPTPLASEDHGPTSGSGGNLVLARAPEEKLPGGNNPTNHNAALPRGRAVVDMQRPAHFPHRIWAACDFESQTSDYGWFGPAETNNIPAYPGNATALGVSEKPYGDVSALMTGINPVPGPRMGQINKLYLRYYLAGASEATFQYFSLSREDNCHLRVAGLTEHAWSEVTVNFTRDSLRNDGSAEPFQAGERMDDFKTFVGSPNDGREYALYLDDIIFFADDPRLPPEPEPFPRRVIFLAGFDTGPKETYWPGDFEILEQDLPADSYWRVASAVPRKEGQGKWIRLQLDPLRTVGAHTKLRFRYFLAGSTSLVVQLFDATVQDNRHIRLEGLEENAWCTTYLDFQNDSHRNDGSSDPLESGNRFDDLFFFVDASEAASTRLLVDEVVLYDAYEPD